MKTKRTISRSVASLLGLALILVAGSATADIDTFYLHPTDDACIDSFTPDTNYGTTLNLYVGDRTPAAGGTCWTFVQFDLGAIPTGAEILNAELLLYKHEKYGSAESQLTVTAHHITTPGWSENAITWNARPGYATAPTASVTGTFNPSGWVSWNVTPDVITDYIVRQPAGWCVKDSPPVQWLWLNFWSREQVPMPDYRPTLEVTVSGAVPAEDHTWSDVKSLFR
jgi:hypothetical protein